MIEFGVNLLPLGPEVVEEVEAERGPGARDLDGSRKDLSLL